MYKLEVLAYVTVDGVRVNAVFEQEQQGKTQKLVNAGVSATLPAPVRKVDHRYMLDVLDLYVPVLLQKLAARLEDELDIFE